MDTTATEKRTGSPRDALSMGAQATSVPEVGGVKSMHPEELMKPDLFCEIVLLGSGSLIVVSVLLIVAAALMRA
jgi:hypothetical protein